MPLPMSETLNKATYNHLKNMIEYLVKNRGYVYPHDAKYNYSMIKYLRENFTDTDINWADQQVKEFYRSQGIKYRAIEGRGRPVGAKNKNRAGVRSNYFDQYLNNPTPVKDSVDNLTSETIIENEVEDSDIPESSNSPDLTSVWQEINTVKQQMTNLLPKSAHQIDINIIRQNIDVVNETLNNLDAKVSSIIDNRPTIVELKTPDDLPNINLGLQHKNFPLLLQAANTRLPSGHHVNIWLHGPAGTGKTTAAEKIAEAFNLQFFYNGALSTAFQLLGYNDANGNYVRTAFRDAWENGGAYLFDEIDGSMPDALLSMNGALANSIASFPDKMVPRHKDCIIIAGANTTGLGGGIEYVGAMKQNAAFLNRFVYIDWPHDNVLEDALCPNKDWLARVRQVRARTADKQIKSHLITMRASIFGASLLQSGVDWQDVEKMVLKCGMTDAQWNMVK